MLKRKLYSGLLAAGAYLLGTSAAFAHSPTVIIEMTPEGFTPREVAVDAETIINFVNKDTVDRWPASNVHPTHDIYPEFDPKRPIPSGDFWIFKPKRAGTFKYHDHLLPHQRGTLSVTPEEGAPPSASVQPDEDPAAQEKRPSFFSRLGSNLKSSYARAAALLRNLFRRNESVSEEQSAEKPLGPAVFIKLSEQEQYQHLLALNDGQGPAAAWEYVKGAYTNNSGAALGGRAHDLAHFTGELIFKNKGLTGLSLCDTTFAFGCYHGFTETAFADSLRPLKEVARACESLGQQGTGPWASCIHGIGHGVATYFDAVELTEALTACDRLPAGAAYCYDGVFMEFSFSAPPSFYASAEPLAPCTKIAEMYQQACARNQPHVMQQRFNLSRAAIASVCANAPAGITDPCIDSLGFAIANESQGDATVITTGCRELPNQLLAARCVSAAAGELVFQNFPNWQTAAPAACASLDPTFRASCQARVEATAQNYQRN